jgi:hypothetical protein
VTAPWRRPASVNLTEPARSLSRRAMLRAEALAELVRGEQAFLYRASMANAARREDRGETPVRCEACRCETDQVSVAHDPRCRA